MPAQKVLSHPAEPYDTRQRKARLPIQTLLTDHEKDHDMGINRIDHAAIYVGDLGKALSWYEDVLDMTVLSRTDDTVHLACRGKAADLTLVKGTCSLDNFTFGVDDEQDLDRVAATLTKEGVAHERFAGDSRPGEGAALKFHLPSGHELRLATGGTERRAGISDFDSKGSFAPSDMDHINLLGEVEPQVMRDFLMMIGFKSSLNISINGELAGIWLRGSEYDHDIAYMKAVNPAHRLHHVAFAVEDGNHYFRLSDRFISDMVSFQASDGHYMFLGLDAVNVEFGWEVVRYHLSDDFETIWREWN
ncbi:VOC family protein [Celeribacter baekdonensis]|uniref:VOC family protein n=1 Tax=Celeribacter baekdonensis TaxID=875171 RepID=UPI0030D96FBE